MEWLDASFVDFLQLWTVKFAAIMGALVGIGAGVWKIYSGTKKIYAWVVALWKDWQEGRDARDKTRAKIDAIFAEVKPNGGSSLRDAINRTERNTASLRAHFIAHLDHSDTPLFHLDENGITTWVNRAVCDLCDATPGDFLGLNWKTFVHPDDLERVFREQQSIVGDKRDGVIFYRLAVEPDNYIQARVALHRLLDESGTIIGWSGELKPL